MNIQKLARKNVWNLKPYSSARDEFEGEASIFLDANENPYPTEYNRYPDPHQKRLKELVAKIKSVKPNQVFIGNGSDEAIDLLFRAFCEPYQDNVVIPQPTYGMYAVSAGINAVEVKPVSLTPDFDIDVPATISAIDSKTKLLFLCSPNNPSGNLLSFEKVITLMEKFEGIVIVDEAYIDFAGYEGFVPHLEKYPNLVVLQTFSKAWGLAGLRLGIAIASEEIISILNKIKPPYNIGSHTQALTASILEKKSIAKEVSEIRQERERLSSELKKLSIVAKVFKSDANFVLAKINSAREVYLSLIKKGIVVRDRSNVILCDDCLRITIGTPEENSKLILALNSQG